MTDQPTPSLAEGVAEVVAANLPAVDPLTVAPAQPGSPHVLSAFAGAVRADVDGVPGCVVICIGQELVDTLAASPLGNLDLAAAIQPALDAAAGRLGGRARAAERLDVEAEGFTITTVVGDEFTTVPVIGTGIAAAILLPQVTLDRAGAPIAPVSAAAEPAGASSAGVPDSPAGLSAEPFVPAFGAVPPVVRGLEMLHGVDMEVTVELGRTRMTVRDLLALTPGAVLELDRAAGSPADLLVNGRLVARGEVVVIDEDFGLRVTEIVDAAAAV
ncbi:MAG: flagellar motor switch protein FliN [Nocardioidaceae bacterium]|nr:flagellar motor switch protein FliN [Nocardioidaceae bacterium]MCL2613781.1 flagellar motor switch protein FliN [Nocardioidaceae bacterium]